MYNARGVYARTREALVARGKKEHNDMNNKPHYLTSEKALERYLRERVADLGGLCLKYTNAAESGFPDRVVLLPRGRVMWVELKSLGEHPRPLQLYRHRQLLTVGQEVWVADSREKIDHMLKPE